MVDVWKVKLKRENVREETRAHGFNGLWLQSNSLCSLHAQLQFYKGTKKQLKFIARHTNIGPVLMKEKDGISIKLRCIAPFFFSNFIFMLCWSYISFGFWLRDKME